MPTDIPGNTTTFRTLRVGGSAIDVIDASLDQDWFQVWLVAGVSYQISLSGSGTSPLGDPLVRLLNSNGAEIARDDDGGDGLNSLLTYTPSATGTYYISAEAYPFGDYTGGYTLTLGETDIAPNTSTTATLVADGYDVRGTLQNIEYFDPLLDQYVTRRDEDWYRIDVQANQTYRFLWSETGSAGAQGIDLSLYNAAGALVYRLTNPGDWDWGYIEWIPGSSGTWFLGVGGADSSGEYTLAVNRITASPLESIDASTQVHANRIEVYFAQAGETFGGITSEGWNAYEIGQAMAALRQYSNVANLTFIQTTVQADAEFTLVLDDNELGSTDIAGRFGLPGSIGEGIGVFDGNWAGWSSASGGATDQGGFGWEVLLHEFGHALGLAHPHDDTFASLLMNGVTTDTDHGAFDLNQGVYTIMSYNSSWETAPHGLPRDPDGTLNPNLGWGGTPMAFDIALIQQNYGANTSYRTGNDTYTLPVVDQSGTFYSCIWDAGGTDTIRAGATSLGATIDLRAATLRYERGGGGWVSYHAGVHGGFTIADGVVIENAIGGDGNDQIIGNAAANRLNGGGGADSIVLGANDIADGGSGFDTASFDGGPIYLNFANNTWTVGGQAVFLSGFERYIGTGGSDTVHGASHDETISLGAGNDFLFGQDGNDFLYTGPGADMMDGGAGFDTVVFHRAMVADWQSGMLDADIASDPWANWEAIQGSAGDDRIRTDSWGYSIELRGGAGNDVLATGVSGVVSDRLSGEAGNDALDGGAGDDRFDGGAGNDSINGRTGNDTAIFTGNRSNYVINALANGDRRIVDQRPGSPDGTDTLHDVESIVFADRTIAPVASVGDVLWRHHDGIVATADYNLGAVPTTWQTHGIGDFDGDGDGDVLWRHQEGAVVTWEFENGQLFRTHSIASASDGWEIVNTGDFDADSDSDVLWRHREGAVVTWEIEDGTYVRNHNIALASTGWIIQELGDFDGDGDDDVLWRHQQGAVVTWEMEDGAYVVNHNIAFASTGWAIRGTGDFDGDGDDDILWHHAEGAVVTWEMENGAYVTSHSIASGGGSYAIAGIVDFNADNTDDILWRHTGGAVVTWEMDGGALRGTHGFGVVGNDWQIRGTGEFDLI